MPTFNRGKAIEKFRNAVLIALDEAAADAFELYGIRAPGADETDLPMLFRVIDTHVERVAKRYDIILTDKAVEEEDA